MLVLTEQHLSSQEQVVQAELQRGWLREHRKLGQEIYEVGKTTHLPQLST